MLLISPLTNLGVTYFFRFCLFLHCFMMTKSILWWLLTHRFWNSFICEGQLPLDTIYAPDSTLIESRSYFIVELLSFSILFQGGKIISLMLLTHRFPSCVLCEVQPSLVAIYAPDFTVNESRNYFIFEVLTLCILFHDDKSHTLMVANPSFLEFCLLRRSAFAC